MKTNDEILKDQGIIRWHDFFKKAMIAAQFEILDEFYLNFCATSNEKPILEIIDELKSHLNKQS